MLAGLLVLSKRRNVEMSKLETRIRTSHERVDVPSSLQESYCLGDSTLNENWRVVRPAPSQ